MHFASDIMLDMKTLIRRLGKFCQTHAQALAFTRRYFARKYLFGRFP